MKTNFIKKYKTGIIILVCIIALVFLLKKTESFAPSENTELDESDIQLAKSIVDYFKQKNTTFSGYMTLVVGSKFDKLISKPTYDEFVANPSLQVEHVFMKMM